MAKVCASCGKPIPEDLDICPNCGSFAEEDGAALFTRISAETEGWQIPVEKTRRPRPQPTKNQKIMLAYILGAVAVIALAVFLILYIQPVNRVVRAINAGNYDEAVELYWGNTGLASGAQDAQVNQAALRAARDAVDRFSRHELSAEETADALGKLGSFGRQSGENLAGVFADFRAYSASQEHMNAAGRLAQNGDFLAAREEYLLVAEGDSAYAEAQEKAAECLDRYGESVISAANVYIQSRDFAAALLELENGRRALLGFDVYNEKLDYKLNATYTLYERALLSEAKRLAAGGDFAGAVSLMETGMARFEYESEELNRTLAEYREQAKEKKVDDAESRAAALYAEERYEEAFALLEEMKSSPESDKAAAQAAIENLEQRFAADQIARADGIFGNVRANLPEAVAGLKAALRVRELEALEKHLEELSAWLPASLATLEYVDKQGTIFRSSSEFEGLDGVNYTDGWVWGENAAELTFVLEGNYDLLEGTLAVRRDDNVRASGSFVVLCDGEEVYTSETLTHPDQQSIPVSVNISGCQRLTLRFVNDYTVRTAAGGYCYHGFCGPTLTRNLDEPAAEPAENPEAPVEMAQEP